MIQPRRPPSTRVLVLSALQPGSTRSLLATVALTITLVTLTAAYLAYRKFAGGSEAVALAAMEL